MDYPRLKMTVQKGKRMKIREVNQGSLDEIAGYMNAGRIFNKIFTA